MNTLTTYTEAKSVPKFKTTLYLTESNKRRLEQLNGVNRTELINQAIAEKLEELEKERQTLKLLEALDSSLTTASQGVSTEDALYEIRQKEKL